MPDNRNKRLLKNKYLWAGFLAGLIIAGAFLISWGRPPTYYLALYDGPDGEIVKQVDVELKDLVTLEYVHSSDGTPVKAVFLIEQDGLHLLEEEYSWYGAGLEFGSGHTFSFSEDKVTVSGYDRVFHELPLRVARTVSQELHLNEKVISLDNLAPGGTLVIVKVEKSRPK